MLEVPFDEEEIQDDVVELEGGSTDLNMCCDFHFTFQSSSSQFHTRCA